MTTKIRTWKDEMQRPINAPGYPSAMWNGTLSLGGKTVKVGTGYRSDEDARDAMRTYHGKTISED